MTPSEEEETSASPRVSHGGFLQRLRSYGQRQVPREATVSLALWSTVVMLLVVEFITGLALATTYSPSTTDAWGSVFHIQEQVAGGAFVRALHYHGGSVLIVLLVLQLSYLLLKAGYRPPHDTRWFVSVGLLVLVMGFGVTGYVLPWDQQGYWANQTELNLLDTAPGGGWIKLVLAGGSTTGNATLTRFYTLHVFVLPVAVLILLWLKSRANNHPASAEFRAIDSHTIWPTQVFRSTLVAFFTLTSLVLLAITLGVTLDAPADPTSTYEARPKWYFLWLYKLVQVFDGSTAVIATVVFPVVSLGFLLAIPRIDSKQHGSPRPSKKVWIPFVLLLLLTNGLMVSALIDDAESESYQDFKAQAQHDAEQAISDAKAGGINADGHVILFEGRKLFASKGCQSCHQRNAKDSQGPLLSGYGSPERIARFLEAPDHPDFYGLTVFEGNMAPFEDYDGTEEDLEAVTTWLHSLSGQNTQKSELIAKGLEFFKASECIDCHNDPATSFDHNACAKESDCETSQYRPGIEGPDLDGYLGYEWTRAVIRNAGHTRFFGGVLDAAGAAKSMPTYPDLSPADLDLLTQWLLAGAPGAD